VVGAGGLSFFTPAGASSSVSPLRPDFDAAKVRWESAAVTVSGALQNVPLASAVSDLQRGLASGQGNTAGYAKAIATIRDFESIPLTSETPSQQSRAKRDWSSLNTFFQLTSAQVHVLDDSLASGALFVAAKRAYDREPLGKGHGVVVPYLRTALGDLRRAVTAQQGRAVLYQAAIADLRNLATASPSDVATSEKDLTNPTVQDVYFLNAYFETERLQNSVSS
jgi:hypothetical protein